MNRTFRKLPKLTNYTQKSSVAWRWDNKDEMIFSNKDYTSNVIGFDKLFFWVVCIITCVAYYTLHTYYNIYYEDDSWTISNAWNMVNLGVDQDLTFLDQEGVFTGQLFGKIYFFISGSFFLILLVGQRRIFSFSIRQWFFYSVYLVWNIEDFTCVI